MSDKNADFIPSRAEIQDALARIEKSEPFRKSPQLAAFLRYVVEQTLAGKSHYIKGYTIGIEVLRRDSSFDPTTQSIVRTEAGRLRRELERYYESDIGRTDPIRIELPLGRYVPRFQHRAASTGPESAPPGASPPAPQGGAAGWLDTLLQPIPVAGLAVAALLSFVAVDAFVPRRPEEPRPAAELAQATTPPVRPVAGFGEPRLFVEPFTVVGVPPDGHPIDVTGLREAIVAMLSRFEDIVTLAGSDADTEGAGGAARPAGRNDVDIDYVLTPTLTYQPTGPARLRLRLVDTDSRTVVWNEAFDLPRGSLDTGAARDALLLTLATTLLRPYGIVPAHERRKRNQGRTPFRCAFDAMDLGLGFAPPNRDALRSCLEAAIAADPGFGYGLVALSRLYYLDYVIGGGRSPKALSRALDLARKAVIATPRSARAHAMLMMIQNARGSVADAAAAGEEALALNPMDFRVRVVTAAQRVAMGDIDAGYHLLQEARRQSPVMALPVAVGLFVASYIKGDLATAALCADQLPAGLFKDIAQALMAVAKGDPASAEPAVARLRAREPELIADPRGFMGRFIPAPAVVDRLATDLGRAVQLASPGR